jgi:hypothetical protein
MKKLSVLACAGWSIITGSVYAQAPSAEITRDRLCQEIQTGMSIQEVLDLGTSVGIEFSPRIGEDSTVFLEWSDPQTSEEFSASFSCSMIVNDPTLETAEPTTCDQVEMGMSLDEVKTLMNASGFTALPRLVGSNDSLWEWSNPQTAEFLRMIFSNGGIVSISCSTQENEIETGDFEEEQNLDDFLEFGEELPNVEEP